MPNNISTTELNKQSPNDPSELEKSLNDEIIVNGSLWQAIWVLSWPLYLNMMTIAVGSFSEIWVGGHLGSASQAAIGLGGQIWFFMVLLVVALSSGTNALVSRFWGAGDREQAIIAARQSLIFSVIFGIAASLSGILLCRPILRALGASPEVELLGWNFLKYDLIGQIPVTIHWVSNSIFRAKGDTRTPMLTMMLVVSLVVFLNYTLCIYPFHLGISGLGMAWPIASCFGLGLSLFLLRRSNIGSCLELKSIKLSKEWFIRLMKIGIPACVQDLAWVGGNFMLLLILAQTKHPTTAEAAWAVGLRLEEILGGLPIYALSTAVGTIVGQNLGAKKPDRAEKGGWQVLLVGASYNLLVAILLFFGADMISSMMSKDAAVISCTNDYLRIVGLAQPLVAVWLILSGAMQGAGYTRWPMIATVFFLVLIRLPLAYFLTVKLSLGPTGTWLAVSLSAVLVGLAMVVQYKHGKWKTQEI